MMKISVVICAVILLCVCVSLVSAMPSDSPVLSKELISRLLAQHGLTWTPGFNRYFGDWTIADAKMSMGVVAQNVTAAKLPQLVYPEASVKQLPSEFNAHQKWPQNIGPVLNQGKCGSCWAVSCAEAVSDRMSIKKNTTFLQLAAIDLVECDGGMFGNSGCQGGQLYAAWEYVQDYGLVTEACAPYGTAEGGPIPTCAPTAQPCLPPFVKTPPCTKQCKNGDSWSADKHKVSSVYSLSGVQNIMTDIVANGPVQAAFTVYADFLHYKSGVYKHTTGSQLGGHAIKIVGYGTENGDDYWLVQNSWTTTWGDNGFFKIARGIDECGIEDDVVAGAV